MITQIESKGKTIPELRQWFKRFKETTKHKEIVQVMQSKDLKTGTYGLLIIYDDGRQNTKWITGGDSIK